MTDREHLPNHRNSETFVVAEPRLALHLSRHRGSRWPIGRNLSDTTKRPITLAGITRSTRRSSPASRSSMVSRSSHAAGR